MSEEQSLPVAKLIDKEIENKRNIAWGKLGVQIYHSEIILQLRAQEITSKLIDPTAPELIKQAEEAVAVVKKEYDSLQEERKVITSKFDPVIARLMEHEKAILKCIQINQEAILKQKQHLKEAAKTEAVKAKELKDVAAQVRVYVADMHAAFLSAQLSQLAKGYEYALSINLSMEALPEFIQKLCARVNIANCTMPSPHPLFQYNTQEAIDKVVAENFNPWPAQRYVDGFALDVTNKFSDWEQALKNKETAKKLNDDAVAETTAAISDQKAKQATAAKLEALAIPLTEGADIKPLKEVWHITEPTNWDEIFAIINAFAVNRNLVQKELSKIKPINFGIKQMIAALLKVKADDENFECTGITFTKIDKL